MVRYERGVMHHRLKYNTTVPKPLYYYYYLKKIPELIHLGWNRNIVSLFSSMVSRSIPQCGDVIMIDFVHFLT